ncbi:hypothetical protein LOAG_09061 [Loa loa]|uniref:Uncharacterized protein n=1 Tax=Loa loa TaxID=7209 RepID=A0A1I7VNC4_LOALO|nr:hypothetical protein LOAG_09061 [Loa loa]EFO19434.1 hypothetical protein LOAG_09061 [Loa loa]
MDNKRQWLFIAIIIIVIKVIHVEAQPFIGAWNNPFVTVSKLTTALEKKPLDCCHPASIRNVESHKLPQLPLRHSSAPPTKLQQPQQYFYHETSAVKKAS